MTAADGNSSECCEGAREAERAEKSGQTDLRMTDWERGQSNMEQGGQDEQDDRRQERGMLDDNEVDG